MVPKGFLRYRVLRLLNDKPMSGSEIVSEIERQTEGRWKPSPGSIYPLLACLQEKGHIEGAEGEAGTKCYALTESGKTSLGEHDRTQEQLRERLRDIGPGVGLGPPWYWLFPERTVALIGPTRELSVALGNLRDGLKARYSEEVVEEAEKALAEAALKIEEAARRLQESDMID